MGLPAAEWSDFGTGPRALSGEVCRSMQESVHEDILARKFVCIKDCDSDMDGQDGRDTGGACGGSGRWIGKEPGLGAAARGPCTHHGSTQLFGTHACNQGRDGLHKILLCGRIHQRNRERCIEVPMCTRLCRPTWSWIVKFPPIRAIRHTHIVVGKTVERVLNGTFWQPVQPTRPWGELSLYAIHCSACRQTLGTLALICRGILISRQEDRNCIQL